MIWRVLMALALIHPAEHALALEMAELRAESLAAHLKIQAWSFSWTAPEGATQARFKLIWRSRSAPGGSFKEDVLIDSTRTAIDTFPAINRISVLLDDQSCTLEMPHQVSRNSNISIKPTTFRWTSSLYGYPNAGIPPRPNANGRYELAEEWFDIPWDRTSRPRGTGRPPELLKGSLELAVEPIWPEPKPEPFDQVTAETVSARANSFIGTWITNWGPLTIQQDGDKVVGIFRGKFTGTIEGKVVDGRLEYTWKQTNGQWGSGVFRLTDGGQWIKGTWGAENSKEGGQWTGKRSSSE
jgi:hypothetical protein